MLHSIYLVIITDKSATRRRLTSKAPSQRLQEFLQNKKVTFVNKTNVTFCFQTISLALTKPAGVALWAHVARATLFIHHRRLAAFGTKKSC
jgi:hypothetical protein